MIRSRNCQNCKHWKPLFDRSFFDLPGVERDRILAVIKARILANDSDDVSLAQVPPRLKETIEHGDPPKILDWPMWGDCTLTELDNEDPMNKQGRLALACDGSAYFAILRTRANFGCTEWDVREFSEQELGDERKD